MSQAEEYLSQAQWTVLKTPECSNAIKSKLYRNLGLLYAAKGEYDEALRQLADDVSLLIFSTPNQEIVNTVNSYIDIETHTRQKQRTKLADIFASINMSNLNISNSVKI